MRHETQIVLVSICPMVECLLLTPPHLGNTVMPCFLMGICSERCVISSLCEHHKTYSHKPRLAYHTQRLWYSLLLLGYKPGQHVTTLSTVSNCSATVSIVLLYDWWRSWLWLYQHRHKHTSNVLCQDNQVPRKVYKALGGGVCLWTSSSWLLPNCTWVLSGRNRKRRGRKEGRKEREVSPIRKSGRMCSANFEPTS